MLKLLTLDSNIFISETKGNEKHSDRCKDIISRVGSEFLLAEPAVLLAESHSSLISIQTQTAASMPIMRTILAYG